MRVYLASRYSRRGELCGYRAELQSLGIEVTSRWLNGNHQLNKHGIPIGEMGEALVEGGNCEQASALRQHFVAEDIADVLAADCVISFTEEPRSQTGNRGGRHVEFGVALATNKRLIVVGHRENLFHWWPTVEFVTCWLDAVSLIIGTK